jgi:hypothetical protein
MRLIVSFTENASIREREGSWQMPPLIWSERGRSSSQTLRYESNRKKPKYESMPDCNSLHRGLFHSLSTDVRQDLLYPARA